jgi:hypothetical protein
MMVVHESGHVLGALVTGGTVNEVILHPFSISRTDVSPNPMPLVVVWAGPLIGCSLPTGLWLMLHFLKLPFVYLARFFAGFCFVANGAYVAVGAFEAIGDPGDMLRHGNHLWQLILFGSAAIPIGFLLWHGEGDKFGLGKANGHVDFNAVYLSIALFSVTFIGMLLFG